MLGKVGAVSYSLIINGVSGLLTALAAIIILIAVKKAYPKLFNLISAAQALFL